MKKLTILIFCAFCVRVYADPTGADMLMTDGMYLYSFCGGQTQVWMTVEAFTNAAALAGRTGGQTFNGGSNSTENLTLASNPSKDGEVQVDSLFCSMQGLKRKNTRIIYTDSPYTLPITNNVLFCDSDTSNIVVNLPPGIQDTYFRIINTGTNAVTIDGNGAETIRGTTNLVLQSGEMANIDFNSIDHWW